MNAAAKKPLLPGIFRCRISLATREPISKAEKAEVVANCDHLKNLKFSRTLPFAFTEHGAIMAATILKSKRAVEVSVFIVRVFVRLRQMLTAHKEIAEKFAELESKVAGHDEAIRSIVSTIRQLMEFSKKERKKGRLGFNRP